MKKHLFLVLTLLMSLSLIGIIFVQGYWIKNTLETKEEQFSFNAKQTLITVADQLEKAEIDEYYVQYSTLADSTKPSSAALSEMFNIKQDELTNETFYFTNKILQEDYKFQSQFLKNKQDSVNFKKLTSSKVTRIVRKNDIEKSGKITAEDRYYKVLRLEDNEKFLLNEAIKEKAALLPIYKRVDTTYIKDLIDAQLEARDIDSRYAFAIYSGNLATKVKSEEFNKKAAGTYGINIFESENTNYKFYINFLDKKKEILTSIALMAVLSIVFTIIIIFTYSSTLSQVVKQKQISQIKTDFINNMTHEFKTPIATIKLALDSVKNPKISEDPDKVKRYLNMIRDENQRMHAQVENILRISKLERNELDIRKEKQDLHELIDEAVMHTELITEDKHGYLQKHYGALRASILGNESHLVNVIVNLLENAVKYSGEEPKIDIYTENVKEFILLKIRDQGKGMSKQVQKKVFKKFYREHTGDVHDVKGHGLGLAYAKKIIEDHHGDIVVESTKGAGSTFIIKLPLIS